jgi:hypothetical protein
MSHEERSKLKKIPKNWKNNVHFINRELTDAYGFCYPSIYDIVSLHKLYELKDSEINKKIDAIIEYISNDDYNSKIADGYGIVIVDGRYYGMGWDTKYPGWFDLPDYMKTGNVYKLLFFAEYISKYPIAVKTKWFASLLDYLEEYKTENGTYIFPAEWLKESTGYAVLGHHVSFGENRRKKNWREIESTFYMLLLKQNMETLF